MKSPVLAALTLTLSALSTTPAHALEAIKSYERFGDATLSPARWSDAERVRVIKGNALNLVQRNWGATTSDSGSTPINFNENLANPAAVTALAAKITVNALEANACNTNPAVAQSRARIVGAFFNVGTPTPGSEVNDVIAQVKLTRFSNSADPAGVLRVQGVVNLCTDAPCNASTLIGSVIDLGTVAIGTAATVQMQWDQPNKTFYFSRDSGAASGLVTYTQSDASPPAVPFKQLSTRMDVASCLSGPQVSGLVDASFDNVAVNKSAAP